METTYNKKRDSNYLIQYLVRIGSNLEKICNRVLAEYNLTQQQLNVLNEVQRSHGITRQQIIMMYGYEKSNLSKIISKLENLQYITSVESKDDKRVSLMYVSEKGTQAWRKCIQALDGENKKIWQNIKGEQMQQFKDTAFEIFKIVAEKSHE